MKPVNFKSLTYIGFGVENNEKNPIFKVDDHVGISWYKNNFAKSYKPNWSEVSAIEKIKIIVPWIYVLDELHGKKIVAPFYEKKLQNANQTEIRVETVTKK